MQRQRVEPATLTWYYSMPVTILLYNDFPSRNLVRREENDAMV